MTKKENFKKVVKIVMTAGRLEELKRHEASLKYADREVYEKRVKQLEDALRKLVEEAYDSDESELLTIKISPKHLRRSPNSRQIIISEDQPGIDELLSVLGNDDRSRRRKSDVFDVFAEDFGFDSFEDLFEDKDVNPVKQWLLRGKDGYIVTERR